MKAIALISGGLDSILAAKLIQQQDIEVIPLNFQIPFCHRDKENSFSPYNKADTIAKNLRQELKKINLANDFLEIIRNPQYGFGSNMNPCIDCKILMLRRAKELMQNEGAEFVITGEVLGQRPMSQHRQALEIIEKKSGLENLVLRPLSARLLPETIPEQQGWVKRDKLLNFSGRTRKLQIELAKNLNIKDYPNPAGGCLLTDPEFTKRLKDILEEGELNLDNVELLKIGRHFRIGKDTKLVVGRDEKENKYLLNLAKENDFLFMPTVLAGPTSLGRGVFDEEMIKLACSVTCRYCDLNGSINADIVYKRIPGRENKILKVSPIEEKKLISLKI